MKQDDDYSAHLRINFVRQWQAWRSYNKLASRIRTKLSFASNAKIKTFSGILGTRVASCREEKTHLETRAHWQISETGKAEIRSRDS